MYYYVYYHSYWLIYPLEISEEMAGVSVQLYLCKHPRMSKQPIQAGRKGNRHGKWSFEQNHAALFCRALHNVAAVDPKACVR